MERITRFRHNVMSISDIHAFESIKGEVDNDCKDVYFVRAIGTNTAYLADIQKMDDSLLLYMNVGSAYYQRLNALPRMQSAEDINFYAKCYADWMESGRKEMLTRVTAQNKVLAEMLSSACVKVEELFKQENKQATDSIIKNFIVKLLFWYDSVFTDERFHFDEKLMMKIVAPNVVKKQEYLFFYLVTLMGCDVLLLQSKGDISAEEEKLGLSSKFVLGEFADVTIPVFQREEPQSEQSQQTVGQGASGQSGSGQTPQGQALQGEIVTGQSGQVSQVQAAVGQGQTAESAPVNSNGRITMKLPERNRPSKHPAQNPQSSGAQVSAQSASPADSCSQAAQISGAQASGMQGNPKVVIPPRPGRSQSNPQVAAPSGQGASQGNPRVTIPAHPGRSQSSSQATVSSGQGASQGNPRVTIPAHPGRSQSSSQATVSSGQGASQGNPRVTIPAHPGRSQSSSQATVSSGQGASQGNPRVTIPAHPGRSQSSSSVTVPPRSSGSGRAVNITTPTRPTASEVEKSFEELAMLASSVVLITVYDEKGERLGSGSGIMIGKEGYILTNNHVAAGGRCFSVRIEDDEKEYRTDEIIKYHSVLDLAIIRIQRKLNPIPVYKGRKPLVRGQKVVAIGSPLGLFNSVSDGIISGFRKIDEVDMIQFTAPTSRGSSGGAVLNMQGEVIGISTAGIDAGQNINLAMGYECINMFIRGFI